MEFSALQDELEVMVGLNVDLLTRRSIEQDPHPAECDLGHTREIYAA
jgi:predicted nucleotidyltransferase